MISTVFRGSPHAENPHLRFDDGEIAPMAMPSSGSLHITGIFAKERIMVHVVAFFAVAMAACSNYAANVTLTVPHGQTMTVAECLAAEGKSFDSGDIMVKKGSGAICKTSPYKDVLGGFLIEEGVFKVISSATEQNELGPSNPSLPVTIKSGATMLMQLPTDYYARNIDIHLAGEGNSEYSPSGAVVFNTDNYCPIFNARFHLDADTTISSIYNPANPRSYCGMLSYATIYLNGHTLKFKATNPDFAFRWRIAGEMRGSGTVVLDSIGMASSVDPITSAAGERMLKLVNGARFLPGNQSLADCFQTYDCEYGTMIGSDRASSDDKLIDIMLRNLTGAPEIFKNIHALTITGMFKVRVADLNAGHCLCASFGSSYSLTFANGSTFDIDTVQGLVDNTDYVVATAPGGIAGLPSVTGLARALGVTLSLTGEGTSLVAHVPEIVPPGAVNVLDWGVLPGIAYRSGNSARFADKVADTNNVAVFFYPGEKFYFDDTIAVSGRDGIVLLGIKGMSEVVAPATASAVITATDSPGIVVSNLILSAESGFSGVAVSATGCESITVDGNTYDGIPGGSGDSRYPVILTECMDAFVGDNTVADGTVYTALAYASNDSTLRPGSEPQDAVIVLTVPTGVSEEFYEAFARTGRESFPQGAKLMKRGAGTLASTNTLSTLMSCFEIEGGVLELRKTQDGGIRSYSVTNRIASGATLYLNPVSGDAFLMQNQTLAFSGTGVPELGGAIVVSYSNYEVAQGLRLVLDDDAAIANVGSFSPNGLLSGAKYDLRGHALTILGAGAASNNYRIRVAGSVCSTGRIVVDGATLSAKAPITREAGVEPLTLALTNGAVLKVSDVDNSFFRNMVGTLDADVGCLISSDDPREAIAPSIANLIGAPAVDETVTLSVSNSFSVRAADLVAGRHLMATNMLSFAGAQLLLVGGDDDVALLDASGGKQFVLATSAVGIAVKPSSRLLARYGLSAILSPDGKTCFLGPAPGMMIIVR